MAPSGNIYLCGAFSASETDSIEGLTLFQNSTLPVYITSQGRYEWSAQNTDIFVLKCNSFGNIEWVKNISSSQYNVATDIAIYGDEFVCVSGFFSGNNVDFDTDRNLWYDTKSSASEGSGFVAEYNTNGNLTMLKTIDGGVRSRVQSLDVTKNGSIVIGGDFKGEASFDAITLSSTVSNPMVAVIDSAGNWNAAKRIEYPNYASISNVEITSDYAVDFIGFEADSYTEGYNISSVFYGYSESELIKSMASSDSITPNSSSPIKVPARVDRHEVVIYPNPASTVVHIASELTIKHIDVYTSGGIIMASYKTITAIDVTNFPKGWYLLKIQLEDGFTLRKYLIVE